MAKGRSDKEVLRKDAVVLGVRIGTCTGFEQQLTDNIDLQFFDFQPVSLLQTQLPKLPGGEAFYVNFDTGVVEIYGDENKVVYTGNIIDLLTGRLNATHQSLLKEPT